MQQTQTADEFDELFEDSSDTDAGSDGEELALTLSELNSISGRKFSTKEEAIKHYQNLNSLVGDQKRIETEKKAKEAEKAMTEKEQLATRIAELERETKVDKFLLANPGAKESLEVLEAYAEKKGLTLDEAWKNISGKFASATKEDDEDEVGVKSKQRITPVQSQQIADLSKAASSGSSDAQEELVKQLIWKK